ncbi:MAG TPA: hypothetical protein VFD83_03945 [Candidatus Polarisedimenticolia bacterium]|nr:hypothetical protein [Candidatus Polarisedimenticolia bacterium]
MLVAFWNGSAWGTLSEELHRAWGFGPLTFWREHWHTLATNTFLVRNALMLAAMVAFIAISVGVYEWMAGTRRAMLIFWIANAATLLLMAGLVVLPMRLAGIPPRWDWAPIGDVGASFGGCGCLGAWIVRVPRRRTRLGLFTLVVVASLVKYVAYPELFGDVGHLMAVLVGASLGGSGSFRLRSFP